MLIFDFSDERAGSSQGTGSITGAATAYNGKLCWRTADILHQWTQWQGAGTYPELTRGTTKARFLL